MKKPGVSQDNRMVPETFGQAAETSRTPKKTRWSIDERINPQPSVQPVSERFPALEEQEIILTLLAPEAGDVKVAGNFNGWQPEATPLKNTKDGEWAVRLMLRSGQYEYRFVVDGQWIEDPLTTQRTANPYGGFNSIFMVPLAVRTSIL
jgi:1,4-alpha-glucan branching enzyme